MSFGRMLALVPAALGIAGLARVAVREVREEGVGYGTGIAAFAAVASVSWSARLLLPSASAIGTELESLTDIALILGAILGALYLVRRT